MRRTFVAVALSALVLTGCAGTDDDTGAEETPAASASPSPSESSTEEPSEEPSPAPGDDEDHSDAIEIEIEGDTVEPNGRRVKVSVGDEIMLAVESDRAAELHVHSSPEQVLDVSRGESMLTLTVDKPGLVDVEEHATGIVVLRLEVR